MEFTRELLLFDLLQLPLYHGWVVDPHAEDVAAALGTLSYNQLVEKVWMAMHR